MSMYLSSTEEMWEYITKLLRQCDEYLEKTGKIPIVWLDTEVAFWNTKTPKLSLIQILGILDGSEVDWRDRLSDLESKVVILDVLEESTCVDHFITSIMYNPKIRKVFHNKSYDLRFLGGLKNAENVDCTLLMSRSLQNTHSKIYFPDNNKLGTLIEFLRPDIKVDKSEQSAQWEVRPLTSKQLEYITLDPIFTMIVDVYQRSIENKK